jgi:site-specific DNA recombinase
MPTKPPVRCAIYTRKSTEEGLQQEFNSLEAQREAAEAYIASQQHEGWTCLPTRYDDGGFTGANMERPSLRRLLDDIAAGYVDAIIVYKVDRLSRSLLDFAKLMAVFDQHQVAFVSVTQLFNTATSMGRLILNVLLSFAQFERELISERTRDKIAATRRKGKWSGGPPVLGYDVRAMKLVVNEAEAAQVRAIYDLFLQRPSLRAVVDELERRSWRTKRWRTKKGHDCGGLPFTKGNLRGLLTNVLYAGNIKYRGEVHRGQQPSIVDPEVWQQVQERLRGQTRANAALEPNGHQALLKGLLYCRACRRSMTPAHCTRKGGKRYRYYICTAAQKLGWHRCPAPSLAAQSVEQVVLQQLKHIAQDSASVQDVLNRGWQALAPQDQARVLRLIVQRVEYDGSAGKLALALHPSAEQRLAAAVQEKLS